MSSNIYFILNFAHNISGDSLCILRAILTDESSALIDKGLSIIASGKLVIE